jgi:SAM-dependent methyltransferase
MSSFERKTPALKGGPNQELFLEAWQVYRKMVDNDYLFHRDAYVCLHEVLADEVDRPFRFLDVACGDAGMSVGALAGTRISHYTGIDISEQALAIAADNVKALGCQTKLRIADFAADLASWEDPLDIVWIGLSLHHLLAPGKLDVLRHIRRNLGDKGMLMIYEDTSMNGESREEWLGRWDAQKPRWTAYTEDEWNFVTSHVHTSDFPETDETWRALGRESGFGVVRERYRSPTELLRLYSFAP